MHPIIYCIHNALAEHVIMYKQFRLLNAHFSLASAIVFFGASKTAPRL